MTSTHRLTLVAGWGLALGACWALLSGCKGNAQPPAPPPPEVSVIELRPGPVTVYAVRGKGRGMHFTSFFTQHRRLMELLVERAGLSPLR